MRSVSVREAVEGDVSVVAAFLAARWGSIVVSRGTVHRLASLPALVAEQLGTFAGCLTYRQDGPHSLEVITIDAATPRQGIGTALMRAVRPKANRIWLVTTNANLAAQAFYSSVGMKLVGVYRGAIAESRRLKPSIPLLGENGIRIEDELLYEWSAPNTT